MNDRATRKTIGYWLWAVIFTLTLAWSLYHPKDLFTWFLETLPALIGAAILIKTYHNFRLTRLSYQLILVHCIILMIGAHYTYAEVPLFDTIRPWFGFERNNYDKVGHFAQGFIPAIVCREIVIRQQVFNGDQWRNFFTVCFCLGFSAFYELIEWGVALGAGISAEAFLGTQGYAWDTQSDMGFALIGAIAALVLLAALHDRQLSALGVDQNK
ncbi:MAG: DUF2238 domain-containing protein [Hahellaceae bacterium]|nr:DUF2238 domain-containing protein [Hahellaceae bacterium]MCP5211353.1 DUF2238 domain-containing protein [Hahellaceae bacterium]